MTRVGTILRTSGSDLWRSSFWLIVYNILWITFSVPGMFLIAIGYATASIPLRLVGSGLLILWPFLTFGLFHAAFEVGEERDLQWRTIFDGGRAVLKDAYVWGLINILLINLLLSNIQFYTNPASPMSDTIGGAILGSIFLTITALWILWQPLVIALHSRGNSDGLLSTYKDAWAMVLADPVEIFIMLILNLILVTIGLLIPPIGFLVSFSAITVFSNRTVKVLTEGN